MNLIFRIIYVILASFGKPKLPVKNPSGRLEFRVLPNDIDLNRHMNNGRYLTICDLSRVDIFIRSGLAKQMVFQGWVPVITEHTMNYKKSLSLFQKYEVTIEVVGWDKKNFQMRHTFKSKNKVIAEGTSKGCILKKGKVISPEYVMTYGQ